MAAARQWGIGEFKRLDRLTQSIPHPDAAAAVIAGQTEINAHFATPPFQDQELAGNPKAHIVLNSYEVQGGPSSSTVLYATEKYLKENPKTYRALVDALAEAAALITQNPEAAADAYLRVNKSSIDRAFLLRVIKNPQVQFKVAPQNTLGILLMDEPFAALDALTRRQMQEELQALWEEIKFTMLFVTHSIEEALVVGNRILLLSPHPGRVRAELNSHQFGLHSAGGAEFQAASARIHGLLFGAGSPDGQQARRVES